MPSGRFFGSLSTPRVDVTIDTGNHILIHTLDGFLKIGTVAATRSIADDSFKAISRGFIDFFFPNCFLSVVFVVILSTSHGVGTIRGTTDWKNAMIGGALTGAVVSAATSNDKERIVSDALTGGAIATASVFLNNM
ncbi:outer envelope pore protein 16, chloroplastic-like [Hibiscus syriacus]|uniref:outer envelope pore protein 16, chloroplastic-like n=1 Tax=Hibiscus syriacus TaxID=106335 RepID=UPI0019222DF9|nr:outer envelope pore protein 16, chloroplastic-like [Hibiscus syriacus]